ncbi:uncharacterized protein TNCV_3873551 [Trichonephila clavipes]|nr:uncharacterized protein TNCV_3873551 [Trichonephila clavipes]
MPSPGIEPSQCQQQLYRMGGMPSLFQVHSYDFEDLFNSIDLYDIIKKKVIESVEEGERKVDVAKAFEIPLSSLSTILKNKEKLYSASSSRVRKHVGKGNFPRLEECLVSWMRQCRGQNIPMGCSSLMKKAKAFAKELRIEFSASEG